MTLTEKPDKVDFGYTIPGPSYFKRAMQHMVDMYTRVPVSSRYRRFKLGHRKFVPRSGRTEGHDDQGECDDLQRQQCWAGSGDLVLV